MIYKETNVFEEAKKRIEMLFDNHEDIIVSMSGGKDSTVVFNCLTSGKGKRALAAQSLLVRSRGRMATYR